MLQKVPKLSSLLDKGKRLCHYENLNISIHRKSNSTSRDIQTKDDAHALQCVIHHFIYRQTESICSNTNRNHYM